MGLGKTLTMISLILKQNEIEDQLESEVDKNKGLSVFCDAVSFNDIISIHMIFDQIQIS